LLIWQYGSASVAQHPWFGIGFGEWVRPHWMGSSVDNFWLLIAIRHGIPAAALIFLACVAVIGRTAFTSRLPQDVQDYRTGYLISLIVFMLVGCTVHFWAAVFAWFLFLLGSGAWILDLEACAGASHERGVREVGRSARIRRQQALLVVNKRSMNRHFNSNNAVP